jgi:hypothetical protein
MTLTDQIKHARGVGAPLIALTTSDQPTSAALIQSELGAAGDFPLIEWDIVRGHRPLNEQGQAAINTMLGGRDSDMGPITNVTEMLAIAEKLPAKSMMLVHQAWLYLEEPGPRQALINLRDEFKATERTLILLGADFRLPPELAQDVLCIDDPLPTPEAIRGILTAFWKENEVSYTPELLERSAGALRGLAAFPVEQASALSLRKIDGKITVDVSRLWERKRKSIENIRGLSMLTPRFSFSDVGGADAWKQFASEIQAGPEPWSCIVWLDEIEKALAGSGGQGFGDSSGVSQDQLGTILTEMELNDLVGATLLGPAGSGKSLLAEATAATFDLSLFRMDLGAAKNMYVGQSEAAIRAIMKTIVAIGGRDCCFIATANGIDALPAALRRRLGVLGVWFVDLPDQAEREAIGKLQVQRFKLKDKGAAQYFKMADGWSGANIRDCCRGAYKRQCTVERAAQFIVPASVQEGDGLTRLRNSAVGRFLSASYPGTYKLPAGVTALPDVKVRKVGVIAEVEETEKPAAVDKSKLN